MQVMNSHEGHMSVPLKIVKREVIMRLAVFLNVGSCSDSGVCGLEQRRTDPEH